jgi:hypothetical protein
LTAWSSSFLFGLPSFFLSLFSLARVFSSSSFSQSILFFFFFLEPTSFLPFIPFIGSAGKGCSRAEKQAGSRRWRHGIDAGRAAGHGEE